MNHSAEGEGSSAAATASSAAAAAASSSTCGDGGDEFESKRTGSCRYPPSDVLFDVFRFVKRARLETRLALANRQFKELVHSMKWPYHRVYGDLQFSICAPADALGGAADDGERGKERVSVPIVKIDLCKVSGAAADANVLISYAEHDERERREFRRVVDVLRVWKASVKWDVGKISTTPAHWRALVTDLGAAISGCAQTLTLEVCCASTALTEAIVDEFRAAYELKIAFPARLRAPWNVFALAAVRDCDFLTLLELDPHGPDHFAAADVLAWLNPIGGGDDASDRRVAPSLSRTLCIQSVCAATTTARRRSSGASPSASKKSRNGNENDEYRPTNAFLRNENSFSANLIRLFAKATQPFYYRVTVSGMLQNPAGEDTEFVEVENLATDELLRCAYKPGYGTWRHVYEIQRHPPPDAPPDDDGYYYDAGDYGHSLDNSSAGEDDYDYETVDAAVPPPPAPGQPSPARDEDGWNEEWLSV